MVKFFNNPIKFLSSAIDPPELDNIIIAFNILLDHHALTNYNSKLKTKIENSMLTKIGSIYIELPLNI
jgi:hypothetical protein